ncbi:hypothetical protein FOTG_19063 [Fusarium oxysporum f. sp. vasinfectum 25433]|uniref:Uncharacterized protein n=1 Tax=Fusarium oxysporum f. sp. vasinfectum 25433 TaxID=1089449 RepID=X0KUT4_FUSOX|nr:hypothetical protein FOTG_19063 [Fusarium oxysporum f. sp. vasinfectum 25433]
MGGKGKELGTKSDFGIKETTKGVAIGRTKWIMPVQHEGCKVIWTARGAVSGSAEFTMDYALWHADANN